MKQDIYKMIDLKKNSVRSRTRLNRIENCKIIQLITKKNETKEERDRERETYNISALRRLGC